MKEHAYIDMPELEGDARYQNRILVFADILGFSQLVYDESKASIYAGILSTLCPSPEHDEMNAKAGFSGITTAVISDTIVISSSFDGLQSFNKIIATLCTLLQFMAVNNVIARGAITVGKLYHNGNVVFGPAMVKAHTLERNEVKYPRFVVDPDCVDTLITANLSDDKKIVFRKDTDGYFYYNFYYQMLLSACDPKIVSYNPYLDALNHLRALIVDNLSTLQDQHVLEKYIWMRGDWNRAIEEFGFDTHSEVAKHLLISTEGARRPTLLTPY